MRTGGQPLAGYWRLSVVLLILVASACFPDRNVRKGSALSVDTPDPAISTPPEVGDEAISEATAVAALAMADPTAVAATQEAIAESRAGAATQSANAIATAVAATLSADLYIPTASPTSTPTMPPPIPMPDRPPPRPSVTNYQAVVNTERLNLREGPDVESDVVDSFEQGTIVQVLGRNDSATWLYVEVPDERRGWMSARYLEITFPTGDLPIVTPGQ